AFPRRHGCPGLYRRRQQYEGIHAARGICLRPVREWQNLPAWRRWTLLRHSPERILDEYSRDRQLSLEPHADFDHARRNLRQSLRGNRRSFPTAHRAWIARDLRFTADGP